MLPLSAFATQDISDLLHSQLAGSNISLSGASGFVVKRVGFSTKPLMLREASEGTGSAPEAMAVLGPGAGLFVIVAAEGALMAVKAVSERPSRQTWMI
jgi:hypothetical protein